MTLYDLIDDVDTTIVNITSFHIITRENTIIYIENSEYDP